MAHTANNAVIRGAKIAYWNYEKSELFTDAERSALRFAQAAASIPNMVCDDADVISNFERRTTEILAVVSRMGFSTDGMTFDRTRGCCS